MQSPAGATGVGEGAIELKLDANATTGGDQLPPTPYFVAGGSSWAALPSRIEAINTQGSPDRISARTAHILETARVADTPFHRSPPIQAQQDP